MTGRDSLRILISDPHIKGGGQVRYVANLARQLIHLGHEPAIACKAGSVLVQVAEESGCRAFDHFFFRGGLRPVSWRHDLATTRRVVREWQPDILHANGSQDHWVAGLANRSLGFPVTVVRTRHNTYRVSDNPANRLLNRRWTDYQIVVCDVVRRELAAQRAFDSSRMCSIHNGVDALAFSPDEHARTAARIEFGFQETDVVCGIVARLVREKGHTFLFQAVARLRAQHPELRVLVLGQGDLESQLRNEAGNLGLDGVVHFAGYRDDMARCVQSVDIGVQPSIGCDTSSFSLKEMMAAGKPVVASDYGGLVEIVTDGVEGYVVSTGAIEPLAEALARLAGSPEMRRSMGIAGRQRVQREFTIDVFGTRTVEAYERALALHRARRAA